jgi:hypothetical protein
MSDATVTQTNITHLLDEWTAILHYYEGIKKIKPISYPRPLYFKGAEGNDKSGFPADVIAEGVAMPESDDK